MVGRALPRYFRVQFALIRKGSRVPLLLTLDAMAGVPNRRQAKYTGVILPSGGLEVKMPCLDLIRFRLLLRV